MSVAVKRIFEEFASAFVLRQQSLDVAFERGIVGAHFRHVKRALLGTEIQRRLKYLFNLSPTFGGHKSLKRRKTADRRPWVTQSPVATRKSRTEVNQHAVVRRQSSVKSSASRHEAMPWQIASAA